MSQVGGHCCGSYAKNARNIKSGRAGKPCPTRKRSPRRASPKKTSPRRASPKKASPRRGNRVKRRNVRLQSL